MAPNDTPSTRSFADPIVGGVPASTSDYPSTVAITDPDGSPFCSGTLVGPALVVTAAHCLEGRSIDDTRVVYGFTNPSTATEADRRVPSLVIVHPNYAPGAAQDAYGMSASNDVGAIVLQSPIEEGVVTAILPEALVEQLLTPGTPMHIAGYGVNSNTTQQSGILYRAVTPHVRHVPTELLAGLPGHPDTCFGDSGGPAYVIVDGTLWLAGATSRAWAGAINPCGESTIYTMIPHYAPWLASLGADLDGGQTEGGFEGGGWPLGGDASDAKTIDVDPACLPVSSECNPMTNEGCDTAAGQACRLDPRKATLRCEDGPNTVGPGGMCDQSGRLCRAGLHCGASIKCETLCCTDADCPKGTPCTPLVTLLGNIGSCGVVYEDAATPDAAEKSEAAAQDAANDTAEEDEASAPDAGNDANVAAPTAPEATENGCRCETAGVATRGWKLAGAGMLAALGALRVRRRKS